MAREFFKNLPETTTPLNAQRMNAFLNGEEAMGSIVVDDITSKNIFDNQWLSLGKRYSNNSSSAFATTTAENNVGILNPIKIDRSKRYFYLYTNSSYLTNGIYFYDENGIWTGDRSFTNPNCVMTYPETAYYMTFNIQGVTDINDLKSYEWMIEYVDSPTSTHTGYAPYIEFNVNKLFEWEDVPFTLKTTELAEVTYSSIKTNGQRTVIDITVLTASGYTKGTTIELLTLNNTSSFPKNIATSFVFASTDIGVAWINRNTGLLQLRLFQNITDTQGFNISISYDNIR